MSQGRGTEIGAELALSAIVVNAATAANGKICSAGVEAKRGRRRICPYIRQTSPRRVGSGARPAGVNLCGRRPNNTSDFDTIEHAPALGFR